MHPVLFLFHHITQYFSTLTKVFICAVQSVHHVIVCGALFLQLWKPFCSVGTDLSLCCFCDCILATPVFFSLSFFSGSLWRTSPLPFLSDLADNLVMDDFTFQEQLLTPRLATAGIGSASSPAAQLRRSYLVPTLSAVASVLCFIHHWPESGCCCHCYRSQTIKWLKHFFKKIMISVHSNSS